MTPTIDPPDSVPINRPGRRPDRPGRLIYRNPEATAEKLLTAALANFQRRFGVLPGTIICHPKWEVEVRTALDGTNAPVQTVSGCLVGEIWLQCAQER